MREKPSKKNVLGVGFEMIFTISENVKSCPGITLIDVLILKQLSESGVQLLSL